MVVEPGKRPRPGCTSKGHRGAPQGATVHQKMAAAHPVNLTVTHMRPPLLLLLGRYKDLQLGRLAMAFGLLQLPRMPELQNGRGKYKFSTDGFVPAQVDADSVRFK